MGGMEESNMCPAVPTQGTDSENLRKNEEEKYRKSHKLDERLLIEKFEKLSRHQE